jgi:hypothetical protein
MRVISVKNIFNRLRIDVFFLAIVPSLAVGATLATFMTLSFICVSIAGPADTATFTYKELNRGVLSTSDFHVVRNSQGYTILVSASKNGEQSKQEIACDSTFTTQTWHYQSNRNTDIFFTRVLDHIEVTGTFHGKPQKKTLAIDGHPWCQIVPLGLQTASRDSSGRSKLWAISLEEPAVLKAVCFCVAGISNELLPHHPEISCLCFHMNIQGLPGAIWTGNYFIRLKDHVFVYFEGHMYGSKKPTATIESIIHNK